tara:strand:+ start:193 stop:396 length:204 start_codon:yes stop_codon:yes gene_type:complete
MEKKPWIPCFNKSTFKTSNKHHDYPIFGYVIRENLTKEEEKENYKRVSKIVKNQKKKEKRYKGADER